MCVLAGLADANGQSYGQPVGPRVPYGTPMPVVATPMTPINEPAVIAKTPTPPKAIATPRSLLDTVDEKYRDLVAAVLKHPTMSVKATGDDFTAHPKVYDWLLEHPDRTCLAWQRMKVPCVTITDMGKGQFHWSDETGSELTWQTVGRFENGVIWYAHGKVKPGTLVPSVPIKAVAVVHAPRSEADANGATLISPTAQVYLLSDSRMATMLTKMVGPTAPRLAEQGAEQLLYFFTGVARHIYRKPEQLETLLAPKK